MSRSRLTAERRREQILESAVAVFGRKGFEGSTTRALARQAGVSEAMIFRFFPDKAALYRAIIDRFIAASGDPFPHAAAEANDDERVLEGLAANLIRSMEQDPAFVRLLFFSALEGHELSRLFLEARILKLTRTLARYLTRRMEEGALWAAPPLPAARAFLGMACNYALMNNLYGRTLPGRMPCELAAGLCAAVFLNGLRPNGRAAKRGVVAGARSNGARSASRGAQLNGRAVQ
ncbi:MAG TPA: TetR/AcrR family transcriptional regulator [Candidatus Polarisedimenticolia bacterium]|nr:TetR/AcrR family transcriptional regulator [Candidatus Polarisedimenticolia bacterium]